MLDHFCGPLTFSPHGLCEYQPLPSRLKFHLLQLQRILGVSQCTDPLGLHRSQGTCHRGQSSWIRAQSISKETFVVRAINQPQLHTVGCLKYPHGATGMDVMTKNLWSNARHSENCTIVCINLYICHVCVCVRSGSFGQGSKFRGTPTSDHGDV